MGVPYSFKRGVGFVEKLEVDIDQLAMKFHDMMIRLQSHHPKRTPTYPWSTPQASHMKGVPSYFKSCWLGGPGSVLVVCWKILRTIVLMVQKSQTTTWDGAKTLSKALGFQLPVPQLVNSHRIFEPSTVFRLRVENWLVISTHLKNISQNGNVPQIGVKITKN